MPSVVGGRCGTYVQVILTDVEMPEMDGYLLTRSIKGDPRFNGIPVLMHSSLSSASNQQLGQSVGVDEYIPKFEPQRLSEALVRLLVGKRRRPASAESGNCRRRCAGRRVVAVAARQRRCAHPPRRLQPHGDPAVLAGHP
jgi:DNA-binding response OmpR family regulator